MPLVFYYVIIKKLLFYALSQGGRFPAADRFSLQGFDWLDSLQRAGLLTGLAAV
jgi:hypothetical protein